MIITESRDIASITEVMRHPEVYGGYADDKTPARELVTPGTLLDRADSLALQVEHEGQLSGYFLCLHKGYGIYEVHTLLLPNCRGALAVAAGRAGCQWMFTHTDCERLVSFSRSLPVTTFAKMVGFHGEFVRENNVLVKGVPTSTLFVSHTLWEWVRDAWKESAMQEIGVKFHAQFFGKLGRELHPEDRNHNGMVGVALYTAITGNQPQKGEAIFNAWAAGAGYQSVSFGGRRGDTIFINCGVDETTQATVAMDRNFNLLYLCQSARQ